MKRLYREMVNLLQNQESFAVATIFDKTGSAPSYGGAKMIIRTNGSTIGALEAGEQLEAEAIRLAMENMSFRQTLLQHFDLTQRDIAADMVCGGKGDILIDFIEAGDENKALYEAVAEILEQRGKAWLITVLHYVPGTSGLTRQQCLVKPDRTLIGKIDLDPYLLEKLLAGPAKIAIHAEIFDNQRVFVEPLRQAGTVYIFGAGQLAQRIAPLSESVGFRAVVLDECEDYANYDRFRKSIEIRLIESFERLPSLELDEDSYIVIVTRGHIYDRIVLEQVLRSKAGYIGMIGSRSKRDQVFNELLKTGYQKEDIDRVFAPIGTNIGAETPEELAVSIVGELIKVRSEREYPERKQKSDVVPCCKILDPNGGSPISNVRIFT